MKKLNIILSMIAIILLGVGSAVLGTSSFLSNLAQDCEVNLVSMAPIVSPKEEPVEDCAACQHVRVDEHSLGHVVSLRVR